MGADVQAPPRNQGKKREAEALDVGPSIGVADLKSVAIIGTSVVDLEAGPSNGDRTLEAAPSISVGAKGVAQGTLAAGEELTVHAVAAAKCEGPGKGKP
eukprot:gene28992-32184_t